MFERLRACLSICECVRAFASICECVRAFASICECVRAFASVCERVRVFASVFERLRTCSSVCERVRARQVAFGRAKFFCVRARLGVFCRHFSSFLVISRPKRVFSGMAGNWRLRLRLGREGSSLLRMFPAPGTGCASCNDIRFKLVCNCGRAAAALVRLANNCTTEFRSLQVLEFPICVPLAIHLEPMYTANQPEFHARMIV